MLRRLYKIAKSVLKPSDNQKSASARRFGFESLEEKALLTKLIDLDPFSGIVTVQGDNANDTAQVYDQGPRVFINLDGFGQRSYLRSDVSRIEFNGGNGNDIFRSTSVVVVHANGNAGDDSLTGGLSNDILKGGDGVDRLFGNLGNDQLIGGEGNDQMFGGDGNDRLLGGRGDDRGSGQGGDDNLQGGGGNDFLHGDGGNDLVAGNAGDDELFGDNGEDRVYGHNGNDILHGGFDNDRLFGGSQNDQMFGGSGEDRLNGHTGEDEAWGGSDDDFIQLGVGHDFGYGGHGNDKIVGLDGNDTIAGGPGNDFLIGNAGADIIRGDNGADILRGSNGDDRLYGDAGPDVIRGESGNDSMYGGSGLDKIWGGSGLDGMFGGIDNVRDRIYGQTDEDRYLFRENDFLGDRYPNNEAIVHFEDKDDQWTDIEVEAVDQTLRMFHFRLQNTDLIRDTISDEPIVFVKAKYLSGGDEGRNDLIVNRERYYSNKTLRWEERVSYERKIVMADWDETDDALNESRISLTTNLMAKNWDSITELTNADEESNQRWENFLSSSDWTDQYPSDPGSYQLSQDGLWWYGTGSSFAKPGGSLNPSEDWSTVWDYYFTVSPTSFDFGLNQKLNQVDSLFDSMFQT